MEGPSPLRRFLLPAIFVAALFALLFLRGRNDVDRSGEWTFRGPTMGTAWTVKIADPDLDKDNRELIETTIQQTVALVDQRMSNWKDDSELSLLNRHDTSPYPVSGELLGVLDRAIAIHRLTGGAFDITVGPLVNAYGFGPGDPPRIPTEAELADLMARTGLGKLSLNKRDSTATKKHTDLYFDLSGIAKGFAVDQVAAAMEQLGHTDYMIEIGGELRTRGRNGRGEIWRIGVEQPDPTLREAGRIIPLFDIAMATSGEYRNFIELDGVRYSHTIDPRTGKPINHHLASVSVLHKSCTMADGIATGLNVLGPDAGYELAVRHGIAALFILERSNGSLIEHATPAFETTLERAREAEQPDPVVP
jgi:thiamine biosynthesis lipoprotein